MPLFSYTGKSLSGATVTGELKAKNEAELERILRNKSILVTSATKKSAKISVPIGTFSSLFIGSMVET